MYSPGNWPLQHLLTHLKETENANSGFIATENFSECRNHSYISQIRDLHEIINVGMKRSHIKCLIMQNVFSKSVCNIQWPSSLDNNTPNRPVLSAWEFFNIRQKLGLFGLPSYVNNDPVETFHVLGPRHLRHDKVALLNIIQGNILNMIEQEIFCKG